MVPILCLFRSFFCRFCKTCEAHGSLISGTIFESSKLPLTTWFLAIYFITQSKDGISALHLRRLLGVSVNAAFRMKQKIQHVMKSADDRVLLGNLVELDDVYWGGKKKAENVVVEQQAKRLFLPQSPITTKGIQFTCE